ncbi:MAG: YggS family pyridoxal phosphate-dependent enzyme [Parabacteroides sp.]|nr:YggS family pyridoxal phosphate-dependent enzyme [Parabacteroides sp.]MDD6078744.1 YggS family pyridoxal phosphate-dependent enzyme [bacterium]MCI7009747.1 YggS family pyridoxal phosphate-dependent enzyme [Parabacteroides sp.]MCI7783600.1 YggS family pyridoxal phosphate-dependent enzyme [Parabacteroides sp.]MDD7061984.1 YggS family pyridoxal phosphate-dependent enzyme [bacterium]
MSIAQRIQELKQSLPSDVTLVAVSKFHPVEALQAAYDAGQRVFGESRAQELVAKQRQLPADIEWHFIGTLQTNKVKEIVPFISLIHSVDSFRLLQEIEKQAAKVDRVIRVLLEIHVAQEETKHGLTPEACRQLLADEAVTHLPHVRICGLMGMASNTDDEAQVKAEFHQIHALFSELKDGICRSNPDFTWLSMGMSHDYPLAIAEGSNLIRIGTYIFGERVY